MPNYYLFRCSDRTYDECIKRMLLGQREDMAGYVQKVKAGDVLFLHKTSNMRNVSTQFVEGPFFAKTQGSKSIEIDAWNGDFQWQVKVETRGKLCRISQEAFKEFGLRYSLLKTFFDFEIPKDIGRKLINEIGIEVDNVNNKVLDYNPLESVDANFRLKYEAKYRCNDGHFVRSKNEVIVDNWLYDNRVSHAYEKKITGEYLTCDFSLKNKFSEDVYIEIWGLNTSEYLERKKQKEEVYKKHNLKLISITEKGVQSIDDFLSDELRKFNCI